jgi:Cu2+-exporting ATPase
VLNRHETIRGLGVSAVADGTTLHVGGSSLMAQLGLLVPGDLREFTTMSGRKGESVVYLIRDEETVAAFAVVDPLRPESREAIDALHDLDIEVAMVTGDSADVVRVIAHTLGVSTSLPLALPEDKVQFVEGLRSNDGLVAMVGDGAGEARVLASADIGIAIGAGIDVADQIADLILLKSDPVDVVRVVLLSEATHRAQLQSTRWAIGYHLAAIPIAAGVLWPWGLVIPPAIAAGLAAIATVVVAVRARRIEGEFPEEPSAAEHS